MTQRAHGIVQEAVKKGTGNFVEEVAAELPLQAIADLIGVPQEDRHKLFEWSNQMLASDDPEIEGDPDVAAAEILGYSMMMSADRQANPRDDLVTKLINAHKGDRGLTDDEFGYFVILLTVAGNETTRNAISHGMNAFLDHPDQWELWKRERPATMVDEVVRWATPVSVFQRTALERRRGQRRGDQEGPAGGAVLLPARTSTRTSSRTRSGSTSPATPTRTSASVDTARTTASAPTWPVRRSG